MFAKVAKKSEKEIMLYKKSVNLQRFCNITSM